MKTSPWFSTECEENVGEKAAHHDNTTCEVGGAIGKHHHRYGTDNRPLCQLCSKLDAQGR